MLHVGTELVCYVSIEECEKGYSDNCHCCGGLTWEGYLWYIPAYRAIIAISSLKIAFLLFLQQIKDLLKQARRTAIRLLSVVNLGVFSLLCYCTFHYAEGWTRHDGAQLEIFFSSGWLILNFFVGITPILWYFRLLCWPLDDPKSIL